MIHRDPQKYIETEETSYQKGLHHQREEFKRCKHSNNYDGMCDSIENIKSEIKIKILKKNNENKLEEVEKIVDWYRQLESHYIKNTPNGKMVLFPSNIHYQVNKNLTLAYEILIEQLDILGLL